MYDLIYSISSSTGIQTSAVILFFILGVVAIAVIIGAMFPKFFPKLFKKLPEEILPGENITDESVDELLDDFGYEYDRYQDIFYSKLDAWQREMGYCRLYDEAAAMFSMIIDCEPVYFEYNNKRWMIELWKGQYGMATGCEIGIYCTDGPDLHTDFFNGTFYECARDDELLNMSLVLVKNGRRLFERNELHWWLTGFMLGEFSEPEELSVIARIKFKEKSMRDEFIKGLKNTGYYDDEIYVLRNTVSFMFDKPRSEQPFTRIEAAESLIQSVNLDRCERYQKATAGYDTFEEKFEALKRLEPDLINEIFLGKNKSIFNVHEKLEKYL
jgi:hypothetical protein